MTHKEYKEKMERGIAQVRAGQGITKTMKELEVKARPFNVVESLPKDILGKVIEVVFSEIEMLPD